MTIAFAVLAALLVAGVVLESLARRRDRARPLPGRLVDVGGAAMHLVDSGAGDVTVVILHGAGDCASSWAAVRREVAAFARVVTFDRPGLGASADRPAQRPVELVAELGAVLDVAGVERCVFVGHSLGGLVARQFARAHPDRVAGFVFVDSTHEFLNEDKDFHRGFAAVGVLLRILRALSPTGLVRLLVRFGAAPMYPERGAFLPQLTAAERADWEAAVVRDFAGSGAGAEFRAVFPLLRDASDQLARASRPEFGDLPLAVVSNPGFGAAWTAMQQELSTRSSRGTHVVSDVPGHNVQMRRPALVVEAIRRVVAEAARYSASPSARSSAR